MNKMLIIATVTAAAISLTACNTVNGAGKDLKSAGGAVSGASGEAKPKGK